ncbi:hypothetical protein HPB48_010827 [Haemaphysalis longicornis]|uniref:Thioredoxin domain-containing protein n=1 Tax=Haemaphysalis longicornis TaxID=44386 RepID=A0A9J6FB96_HAELO|nr:hypothetical protein HPB48_010827 [Haemaphysalis longicornis]
MKRVLAERHAELLCLLPRQTAVLAGGPRSSGKDIVSSEQRWGILFSHPADYTPVCTTELARAAQLAHVFAQKGVKIIALSCDSVDSHHGWIKDIEAFGELPDGPFPYPIIADEKREIAVKLGMLDPVEKDKEGLPLTCRAKGTPCMVLPSVTEEEIPKLFPTGIKQYDVPSGKKYLRTTMD